MSKGCAYITTPIYYPSGAPHIGSAYTSTACDIWSRFKKQDGFETKFLTGTDEHGLKIQRSAEKSGLATIDYLDNICNEFRKISDIMNLSNDDFIRTTEERHKKTAQKMWSVLKDNGHIYKAKYSGWYSVSDETFYTEEQLVDGKSPDSGHTVEWTEEESYFFRMSDFEDKLLTFFDENPDFVKPASRLNEVKSFVKNGLQDLCISRTTFDWGIPVPDDREHVMYVWIDALTNYLSAIDWLNNGENMKFWPATHVVGKDILRFHAIIWPAMLMAAELAPPKQVIAHGWWVSEGKKMSKSYGNVVDPAEIVNEFGQDQLRYYIMREIPFGNDGDFSRDRLIERINADLANSLGNLFQRVLSMVYKNCNAETPAYGDLSSEDKAFIAHFDGLVSAVRNDIELFAFHKALEKIWFVISEANKYMDAQEPWKLKKENPEKMLHVLRILMESFKYITALIKPFMPTAAAQFETYLNWSAPSFDELEKSDFFSLTNGATIPKPNGVFMRIQPTEEAL